MNGRRNVVAAPWSAPRASKAGRRVEKEGPGLFGSYVLPVLRSHLPAMLGSPRWPLVLVSLAVLASLPAIGVSPLNDDLIHRAMLVGPSPSTQPLSQVGLMPTGSGRLGTVVSDLFIAVHPEKNLGHLRAYGALPWWTCEDYRVAFWRPLASFTHWLDYRLFPHSFGLMHIHSILWFAVVVCAVAALYRRLIPVGWAAGLAGLFFVLDDNSYFPTTWVANRNLLLSLFFGILTILVHDRWRRQGWKPGAVVVPLCLLASVLSAEAGVATFAYLFAYEVALQRGPRLRRMSALVPSLVVIVLWRLFYNLQGYGADAGEFYFDPGRDPMGYAAAVLQRAPFLLGGQWTTMPPDLYGFLPAASKGVIWLLLVAVTILIPVILLPFLRASRHARFWLVGMCLAVLPFCATIPMSRSLLFVAIGGFGLTAEALADWMRRAEWVQGLGRNRRLVHALILLGVVAHVPWATFTRVSAAKAAATMEERVVRTAALSTAGCLADQDLVIVNAPNPVSCLYDPYRSAFDGEPLPKGIRILAPGYGAVRVVRTGPRRLVVRAVSDSLLDCQRGRRVDFVFFYRYLSDVRGAGHPFHVGQRITVPRMGVEILAVDERGFPTETAFEFDVPLEDTSLKWLCWDWDKERYEPFVVPPAGATVELVGPF